MPIKLYGQKFEEQTVVSKQIFILVGFAYCWLFQTLYVTCSVFAHEELAGVTTFRLTLLCR